MTFIFKPFFKSQLIKLLSLALGMFLLSSVILTQHALANYGDFGPSHYPSHLTTGIGVYFAPLDLPLYKHPHDAQPVDVLHWTEQPNSSGNKVYSEAAHFSLPAQQIFLAFFPTRKVAILPVLSDDGNGWVEVMVDQHKKATAWVPLKADLPPAVTDGQPKHIGEFQTWLDFMKYNTKAAGFYWLTGVDDYTRALRMAPRDDAKILELLVVRKMTVKHIRGNWLLVEAVDFDRSTPIGWIRWRDKNGKLLLFPNLEKKRSLPIIGQF